ncbi:MAG: type III pantothenate kinase [Verrucomicrobia bacterium]|nr:MAG: type III pantothenate kinase [Verrucomicrobiota bacterium]
MIILFDIGNTNTHLGLADDRRVVKQANIPTAAWFNGTAQRLLAKFAGHARLQGAALCSVVPRATPQTRKTTLRLWRLPCLELTPKTLRGVGVAYPKPKTIGPDRLANAVAVRHRFGAPAVVVDFGTAVTFDVVDRAGNYVGGIIAPGLSAMTDYLHEKTALLPRIKIREINRAVGKSTEEAMLVGAVHGYRGLIRGILVELKRELKTRSLPVVATGGYARLIASKLPEIDAVDPLLTLEGLRLVWQAHVNTDPTKGNEGNKAPGYRPPGRTGTKALSNT